MIELLILYSLLKHDFTMYAIHKRISENFQAFTNPSFGAIKPALVRLEKRGCIRSAKIMSDGGKLSIFYFKFNFINCYLRILNRKFVAFLRISHKTASFKSTEHINATVFRLNVTYIDIIC